MASPEMFHRYAQKCGAEIQLISFTLSSRDHTTPHPTPQSLHPLQVDGQKTPITSLCHYTHLNYGLMIQFHLIQSVAAAANLCCGKLPPATTTSKTPAHIIKTRSGTYLLLRMCSQRTKLDSELIHLNLRG